jgi:hypothetical protein
MLVYVRPSNEAHPLLYLAILREWPRLPFTARVSSEGQGLGQG